MKNVKLRNYYKTLFERIIKNVTLTSGNKNGSIFETNKYVRNC